MITVVSCVTSLHFEHGVVGDVNERLALGGVVRVMANANAQTHRDRSKSGDVLRKFCLQLIYDLLDVRGSWEASNEQDKFIAAHRFGAR